MQHRVLIVSLALACLAFYSCSNDFTSSTVDSGPGAEQGVRVDSSLEPGECTSAVNCGGGELCDPTTHRCVQDLSCSGHADCGQAAYCDGGACRVSKTGSPCLADESCIPGEVCVGGFCGCEGQSYAANNVGPNMLIVLDRSGSMDFEIEGGTKWSVALAAIADLLAAQGDKIRFGLALYPGTNDDCKEGSWCSEGAVWVDPGPDTAAQINAALARVQTCFKGTPTAEMLSWLVSYQGIADTARENYVLLITDGNSTCGSPSKAAAELLALTPEVKTYVVGFGELVSGSELDAIAQSGGTADPNRPHDYYLAEDAVTLSASLDDIAGQVLSCAYTLSEDPANLDKLYVYQQAQSIARDTAHQDGWDYDTATKQLTFYGPACDALRSGAVTDLVIVYGCPILIE